MTPINADHTKRSSQCGYQSNNEIEKSIERIWKCWTLNIIFFAADKNCSVIPIDLCTYILKNTDLLP